MRRTRARMAEVREEVRRRVADFAVGVGYVLGPVHNVQPDVPPENLCAMYEEALRVGQYPLSRQEARKKDGRPQIGDREECRQG